MEPIIMDKNTVKEILSRCDHTLLSVTATRPEVAALIDEAVDYGTASVCIPPCHVRYAKEYSSGRVPVCTVIGFPNGYNSVKAKTEETLSAIEDGADEIDMVINVGALKEGRYEYVTDEIRSVRKACEGRILKVIVEACLLTEKEKRAVSRIVTEAGADYIKTSTGFSKWGAKVEDVRLFRRYVGANVKVKAAGGIRTLETAAEMLAAGADRIGASALVGAAREDGS